MVRAVGNGAVLAEADLTVVVEGNPVAFGQGITVVGEPEAAS
ncbi:hypothetical protein [Streptomyces sp. 3N207]